MYTPAQLAHKNKEEVPMNSSQRRALLMEAKATHTPLFSVEELRAQLQQENLPSRPEVQKIVAQTAALMGVNPKLAMGIAYIESGFDPAKVSDTGAVGPMQLLPGAVSWAEKMVGRPLNMYSPRDNATAGVAILRYLQRHTDSTHNAIAAYYQGLRSLQNDGAYPSTQKFVLRVLRAVSQL